MAHRPARAPLPPCSPGPCHPLHGKCWCRRTRSKVPNRVKRERKKREPVQVPIQAFIPAREVTKEEQERLLQEAKQRQKQYQQWQNQQQQNQQPLGISM